MNQATDTNDAQHQTAHADTKLLKDAIIGQWNETDSNSHVLTIDDSPDGENVLTYEVRDRVEVINDDDYVAASRAYDYYHISDSGRVTEYDLAESIEIGGETYSLV